MKKEYHKDNDGNIILDELGEPISKEICICAAWEPNECICGAWDDVPLEEWYNERE